MFDEIAKARQARERKAAGQTAVKQLQITPEDFIAVRNTPTSTLLLMLNPDALTMAVDATAATKGVTASDEVYNQVLNMVCDELDRRIPVPP